MTGMLLQTGAALAFVILLIAGAAWAYRKRQPGTPGLFRVLAYQPFGPRRGIAAVRVGREVLVLGVTNTDLKLLRVLDAGAVEGGDGVPSGGIERLRKIREGLDG